VRKFLIAAAHRAGQVAGINRALVRGMGPNSLLVLCYHGVVAERHEEDSFLYRNTVAAEDFRKQLEWLAREFHPVALADLVNHLDGRLTLGRRPLLITFDDGYRNNLTIAAPILRSLGIPATVGLATGYIGKHEMLWPDEVNTRVYYWPRSTVPLPGSAEQTETASVPGDAAGREKLASVVRKRVKELDEPARDRYLEVIRQERCAALENMDDELFGFLTWDEVRRLSALGVEIGSHSVTHPILSRIPEERIRTEFHESKNRIQRELGTPCVAITYPNGSRADVNDRVLQAAQQAGYRVGFTLNNRRANLLGPRLAVERINAPGQVNLAVFQCWASGLRSLWA
jgi:peptidoglycan/xylan/chitin deacetylase (PgdA/CDA1 family)